MPQICLLIVFAHPIFFAMKKVTIVENFYELHSKNTIAIEFHIFVIEFCFRRDYIR